MQKRSEITRQERIALVERWQKSGKTALQFCKDENVNYTTFNYWRKRKKRETPRGFVKLKSLTGEFPNQAFCEIFFFNGNRVLFHRTPKADFVKKLLR